MREARAMIDSVERVKAKIEDLGGIFQQHYKCRDIIYSDRDSLREGYLRLRDRFFPQEKFIVSLKKTIFRGNTKDDEYLLNKEFSDKDAAESFLMKEFSGYRKVVDYTREGWRYILGSAKIYVENIGGWRPSVEVEAEDDKTIAEIMQKIGTGELIGVPVPEIMRQNERRTAENQG